MARNDSGGCSVSGYWLHYADPPLAPLRRSRTGAITPIIGWLQYADHEVAPLRRSVTRVSEALTLARHQLDAERCALTFKTLKQRKTLYRSVPIPDELAAQLRALPAGDDDRLWDMHRATAWRIVKATMDMAGIAGPMACCKGLRHGFGMHAASCNVPPNLIQRWMGHSSSSTTAIYLDAVGLEEREFAQRMWR